MAYYVILLWTYSHSQISVLDEGLYLYKGWMFAKGIFTPFQPYGIWTNQMPLAFLIPGWVELLFGAGLRTGRMLAVCLGILMLPAVWLTARRLGGRWSGALVIAALALNPAAIRMNAIAASQGLVACLLAWTLWFSLGKDQNKWQLFCGGLLAGCVVMVRINMLPLLPLLVLYILWAHGWKKMLWSLGGILLTFGGVHLVYWPNILKLWAKWLPLGIFKPWFPPTNIATWNPDNPLAFRIASFFLAFRYNFAALAGALTAWILWPRKNNISPGDLKRQVWNLSLQAFNFKTAVFLSLLFIISFILHAWAALGNEYCVFCFPTYSAFYTEVGLLIVAITLPDWNLNPPVWRKVLGSIAFILLLAGMAYSAEGAFSTLFGEYFYKRLLTLPIPGLNDALLWQVLVNKFHWEYQFLFDTLHTWFPVFIAVIFGLLVLLLPVPIRLFKIIQTIALRLFDSGVISENKQPIQIERVASPKGGFFIRTYGYRIISILILGSFLAPTPVLAGDYNTYDCTGDAISAYETAGQALAKSIPAGSQIYWAGYSPVTLLYLSEVKIFPAQLHGPYSFRISADDDALLKYGWWNEHLAEKWLAESEYLVVKENNLDKKDWLRKSNRLNNFELINSIRAGLEPAPNTPQITAESCQNAAALLLYRRK